MKLPEKLLKRLDGLNDYDTAVRPVFDDGFMTCFKELEPLIINAKKVAYSQQTSVAGVMEEYLMLIEAIEKMGIE